MTTKGTPRSGDLAVHMDGGLVILERRKQATDKTDLPHHPGWWCLGGSGLADFVLEGPDWRHIPAGDVRSWAFSPARA